MGLLGTPWVRGGRKAMGEKLEWGGGEGGLKCQDYTRTGLSAMQRSATHEPLKLDPPILQRPDTFATHASCRPSFVTSVRHRDIFHL